MSGNVNAAKEAWDAEDGRADGGVDREEEINEAGERNTGDVERRGYNLDGLGQAERLHGLEEIGACAAWSARASCGYSTGVPIATSGSRQGRISVRLGARLRNQRMLRLRP